MNTSNLTSPSSVGEAPCYTPFGIIDLLNPKESDVNVSLIAQALSRIPRFNGLTGDDGSYSVAQHCVVGADAMYEATGDKELAVRFLLHDAHEAFLGDITRPVQKCLGSDFCRQLDSKKSKWDEVIYQKFGLTPPSSFEKTDLIHKMDDLMLAYEFREFFPQYFIEIPDTGVISSPEDKFNIPIVVRIIRRGLSKRWSDKEAKARFIDFPRTLQQF